MTEDVHKNGHKNPKEDVKVPVDTGKLFHIELPVHQPNHNGQPYQDRRNNPGQSDGLKHRRILEVIFGFIHLLRLKYAFFNRAAKVQLN